MKETYHIEIETTSTDYKQKKEFNKNIELTEREYLALVDSILTFLEAIKTLKKHEGK